MSKFLVLCVVAVSLSSVYAEENDTNASRDEWDELKDNCPKKYGLTDADIQAAVQAGDALKINPCFWGCYFKMIGLLNDKGQYDLDNYLTTMKKLVGNHGEFTSLENFGKQCTSVKDIPVNDGEAGCELGALVATCFIKNQKPSP